MPTYPSKPEIPTGTNNTEVNTTNWNMFVDNINAIANDLVDSRGDSQSFPGIEHSPGQSTDLDDAIQAIRHIINHLVGKSYWYEDPGCSLTSHDHSSAKGGLLPYSSLGDGTFYIDLHPLYFGYIQTDSLRGAPPSGNNNIIITSGEEVINNVARHFYNGISSLTNLQDSYISVRFTLPKIFSSWQSISIEFKTNSLLTSNNNVSVYLYKAGVANVVASSENNVNTSWSNIVLSSLGSWTSGDILELYIRLASRSNNNVRVGMIRLLFNM